MNFSTLIKDPEDWVKSVDLFYLDPRVGETFATYYAGHRDIYENTMVDLPHAIWIIILVRKFSGSSHGLYSFHFQLMDPTELTYENTISESCSVFGHVWRWWYSSLYRYI